MRTIGCSLRARMPHVVENLLQAVVDDEQLALALVELVLAGVAAAAQFQHLLVALRTTCFTLGGAKSSGRPTLSQGVLPAMAGVLHRLLGRRQPPLGRLVPLLGLLALGADGNQPLQVAQLDLGLAQAGIERAAARGQLGIELVPLALGVGQLQAKLLELPEVVGDALFGVPLQEQLAAARCRRSIRMPNMTHGQPLATQSYMPPNDADQRSASRRARRTRRAAR